MREYDYIAQLIIDRWQGELPRQVYPLQDEARQRLFDGDFFGAVVPP